MSEIRDKQIMVNLEPTFYNMVMDLCREEDQSASAYIRFLIIKDLMSRGIVDDKKVTEILIG